MNLLAFFMSRRIIGVIATRCWKHVSRVALPNVLTLASASVVSWLKSNILSSPNILKLAQEVQGQSRCFCQPRLCSSEHLVALLDDF